MSFQRLKLLALAALCAAGSAAQGVASGAGAGLSVFPDSMLRLREVVVTARTSRAVIPVQQLEGQALERLNALSVADALRYFAGVQLKDYGGVGGIKTVNIRSMGTNHVGVFYDGIQLSNAQNGQVDLGMFSLDNMQAISLFNGQKSQIFQAAKDFSSAGSIYMWTRTPEFDGPTQYHLRARFKSGSFDLVNPSALLELRLSPRVSVSVNGEWLSSSGKYEFRYKRRSADSGVLMYDTTATRRNGDIRATRLEAALFGRLDGGKWMLKAYNYTSERGVPGAIVNNVWRRGERLGDNNSFVQGSWQQDVTSRYHAQLLGKYAFYRTHYENNDTSVMQVDNTYRQQEFYLSTAHLYNLTDAWDVSAAYDVQWNRMEADLVGFARPLRWHHYLSVATAYNAGGLKMQGSLVMNVVDDRTRRSDAADSRTAFTPAFFVGWNPLPRVPLTLRAFAKRSFRMPTFNDLYYTEVGNALLRPERTTQFDVGLAYKSPQRDGLLRQWEVQVDGYRNFVSDKIVAYPKGAQFRWTMLNLGRVHITGVDASAGLELQPMRGLSIGARVQYTYQHAIDVTSPADSYYRDQIPYIPWNSGSANLQLAWRDWNLNYSFIYTGKRYNQQENIRYNRAQPWYTNDVSLQRAFRYQGYQLRAMFEVNNLLSQDYDVILNYPMPKRNYRFTLTLDI